MKVQDVLLALAAGFNPKTRQPLTPTDACSDPEVREALAEAVGAIAQRGRAQTQGGRQRPQISQADLAELEKRKAEKNVREGRPERSGLRWSDEETEQLVTAFEASVPLETIAEQHRRGVKGIVVKLKEAGLLPEDFEYEAPAPAKAANG